MISEQKRIGPGIALKVMAGDKVNIRVSSWYDSDGKSPNNVSPEVFADLVNSMADGFATAVPGHEINPQSLAGNNGLLNPGVTSFFNNQESNSDSSKPRAFVSWILFDEHFNYVSSSSGYEQVGDEKTFEVHEFNDLPMDKSGYLYVYLSNESYNIPVYFDNLQVTHIRGPLVEETHYYPFGRR